MKSTLGHDKLAWKTKWSDNPIESDVASFVRCRRVESLFERHNSDIVATVAVAKVVMSDNALDRKFLPTIRNDVADYDSIAEITGMV